jgi:hypothetical protein
LANPSVPTLASEIPGNNITSALWNGNVYNGLTYALGAPLFVARQQNAQSFNSGTNTPVTWDTIDIDQYGGFNAAVDATKYTVQQPGWYEVLYNVAWANNSTGARSAFLIKNGANQPGSWYTYAAAASNYPTCSGSFRLKCAVGDAIQVSVQQTSGAALSTANPGVGGPWWSVLWCHV